MSTRVNVTINNGPYTLTRYKLWGGPYGTEPPKTISPNQSSVKFTLDDNDRAGVVYLATDSSGNELGFVSMSYTCPKLSTNSAEGSASRNGTFLSAGLQTYDEHGTPANFTYNIGQANKACWDSGSSNNGKIECDQTSMAEWTRVLVAVNNPTSNIMTLWKEWHNGSWVKAPEDLGANATKIFLLNDNDRAGLVYMTKNGNSEVGFATMSFTCPKLTSNSAEGSPSKNSIFRSAGLQPYEEHGTPASFYYIAGEANQACWTSGSSNDGEIECEQTSLEEWARVVLSVRNPTSGTLNYESDWHNGSWAKGPETVPANANRIFLLNDNDRAGIKFKMNDRIPIHTAFTCPKLTSNSAEGSPFAGLQKYPEHQHISIM